MFCLQSYHGLIIDRSLLYKSFPADRINSQVISRFALAQVKCTRKCFALIVNKVLRNCHSWLARQYMYAMRLIIVNFLISNMLELL